jgi:hypothetical protein
VASGPQLLSFGFPVYFFILNKILPWLSTASPGRKPLTPYTGSKRLCIGVKLQGLHKINIIEASSTSLRGACLAPVPSSAQLKYKFQSHKIMTYKQKLDRTPDRAERRPNVHQSLPGPIQKEIKWDENVTVRYSWIWTWETYLYVEKNNKHLQIQDTS